jgi:hypothetical protein
MHMGAHMNLVEQLQERAPFADNTYSATLKDSVPADLLLPDARLDEDLSTVDLSTAATATDARYYRDAVDRGASFNTNPNRTEDLQLRLWLKADDVDGLHSSSIGAVSGDTVTGFVANAGLRYGDRITKWKDVSGNSIDFFSAPRQAAPVLEEVRLDRFVNESYQIQRSTMP